MTLAEAQASLATAKTAYAAAQQVYSATVGDRTVTYQRLESARAEVLWWERQVAELTAAANGSTRPGVRIARWS